MTSHLRDQKLINGELGNLFFLVPPFTPSGDKWCTDLLFSNTTSGMTSLVVTATRSPDERLQGMLPNDESETPDRIGIVDVGSTARNGPGDSTITSERDGCKIQIETVEHPSNLTKIGISLTTLMTEWPKENDQIVICFDSLTVLLQFVDVRTLYQFLHVLTRQVRNLDAMAHYHLDPTAHDQQTINQLLSLFDGVVEPNEAGDWKLRTRR